MYLYPELIATKRRLNAMVRSLEPAELKIAFDSTFSIDIQSLRAAAEAATRGEPPVSPARARNWQIVP
jgi:hypothetical protein